MYLSGPNEPTLCLKGTRPPQVLEKRERSALYIFLVNYIVKKHWNVSVVITNAIFVSEEMRKAWAPISLRMSQNFVLPG